MPGAWTTLTLLSLVYAFNFLDRTLIYILFTPIKAELGLGELELALLGSTSFVIFYTVLGVPFGRLADRVNRVRMIAVGLVVWSVFSGLTGLMHSFEALFACRLMVGVGEATLGPAAISLLADYFPAGRRANANALYAAGVPIGAAAAMFGGGAIAQAWGWRGAFFALGFPGVVLAAVLLLTVREPRSKPAATVPALGAPVVPHRSNWRAIVNNPALRRHTLGYALFALAANAVSMWIPSLLAVKYDQELKTVGMAMGACTLIGGISGSLLGGRLADAWRARSAGGRLRFSATAAMVCVPLWFGLLSAPSFTVALLFLTPLLAAALMWLGPASADLAEIVAPEDRGLAVGLYFFGVNAVGYGLGPPVLGWLAERAGSATDPRRVADVLVLCPVACCVAALCLLAAARMRERRVRVVESLASPHLA
ncbi:MFS transporter [Deltaproteobacteria bacterium]|nr:MFS transporter [Deltaproteobacteria bacterium]